MSQQSQIKNFQAENVAKSDDRLQPVKDLTKIFPDIEGQLCSRHSTLFGKLKTTFNKLYDNFQPTHYIIVKGNAYIVGKQQDQVQLSMGLQNGIIVLLAKTYPNNNIFINGNHIDEELIFNQKGKLQQGLNQMSCNIQKISQSALAQFCIDTLNGGIMYVHANIPQGFYNYDYSLYTALYLSMLAINDGLQKFTIPQLISKIVATKLVSQIFLEKIFYDYQNRLFSLMVGEKIFNIPLQKDIKLLFCRLDLAQYDIKHSKTNIQEIKQDKGRILNFLQKQFGINSFYQAFQRQEQLKNKKEIMSQTQANGPNFYMKLIKAQLQELRALCQLSNNQGSIEHLIKIKWQMDSKIRKIFTQQVIQLVGEIKVKTGIQACTIVQQEFLMIAVDRSKYTQLICVLRQLCHRGQLKSKSCFKLEQQLIQNRWKGEDNGMGQKIFVSVPSKGIGIFDPSQSIWFD